MTLQLQQTCFENIKTLCTNYKKDGAERKNKSYLEKRLESLEQQWQDFAQRHQILLQEIEDKNIRYFEEDVFGKTRDLYEATKEDILKRQLHLKQQENMVQFDLTGMLDDTTNDDVRCLLSKQECNFKAIDRALSKIDLKTTSEKWELEDHLSILKTKWEKIDKLHWELEAALKGSNQTYYDMFLNIEDKYDQMKQKLNRKIWSTVHYQQATPKLQVPEFSGNYSQWISFKDLFMEAIHNNPTINNAQKLQHLKSKLRGEADRLVQHLTISAENYNSCWEILVQRYDNRRLQFTSFMNTMLNLPTIQQPDANNLKKMHDVITECLNGLSNIGVDTSTWGPIIVHLMSQKLDTSTYTEYVKDLQDHRELPNLNDFLFSLESKFMAYETIRNPNYTKREVSSQQKQTFTKPWSKNSQTAAPVKKNYYENKKLNSRIYHAVFKQCPHCDGPHVLMQCPKFLDMDASQRNYMVAKLHLCKNCLYSHGINSECTSTKVCKECNMRHHTLLHNTMKKSITTPTSNISKTNSSPLQSSSGQQPSSNHLANDEMEILLTTVQIQVKSNDGTYVTLRALLDQGSQVNLITENAAQLLRLPRKKRKATVSGIGSVSGDCKGSLHLTCKSIHTDWNFETQALIMRKITNNLPNSTFEQTNWPHLNNLKLADPQFNISRPVDMLLGADVYSDILLDGVLRGHQQSPVAQQTHLGWILCGKLKTYNCHVTLVDLTELTKFWENEEITQRAIDIAKDEQCEEHYKKNVQRGTDGKYLVKMPFCTDFQNKLGKSKSVAISQFLQLEKKLEKNNKLALMYRDFIKEYINLQHMIPVASPISTTVPECYLPHHGVLREQSTTTKLRVVFNASQKTTTGYSLNSVLEKGPNLQKDIQALILKWRSYKYAFTADIEKMYRCIWMANDQQQLQKIIWRDSPFDKLQEYQLCTVTYGTKCAPWLAMRTLKQLAIDDGHKNPAAASILLNEFYVDDLISGHHSLEQAKELQQALIDLLKSGGMNLRKWSTNHPALLQNLTEEQISTRNIFDFKADESTKTLGLGWNPKLDTFMFNWALEEKLQSRITKRLLLSEISTLYDPLGWLSPITVTAKLMFQKVWQNKLKWDEELPSDIQNEWLKMKTELPEVKNIKLNRWIGGSQQTELLGFCDASEKAMACVVYARVRDENNMPTITLMAAKTRVAPLSQKPTLPRLELCGALLLSQLIEKTKEALTGHTIAIKAWCDSQVVLAWIQGETSRWEPYVANRVTKIKHIIPPDNWHYVKSEQNPADCASRGMYPKKLINFELWWQGPHFLKIAEPPLPVQNSACLFTTNMERARSTEAALKSKQDENFIHELLQKCSSATRATRVTAWALRFITSARDRKKPDTNYLTTSELAAGNEQIIKCAQQTEFGNEYKQLMKNETLTGKSTIYKLNPYLDQNGIMRVGGRLNNSNLPFEMKNPIILSRNGRITQLLIEQAHKTTLHGGARLTLAYLRQRYWIVGGNRAVKTKLRNCVRCHRFKPTDTYQLMGDLPQQRATPSRPFTHTGVDFTGHVEIKLNKGRGVRTSKGYIAIFVCMATKAVHIELVSDLSTETFISAFQRMCARRGTPKHVYSDCGSNFIGAAKLLRKEFEYFKLTLSPEFFTEIGKMEVEWHFNAPAWPSAGGLWEAAVKSMKHHLRRVLGDQKLTYEEFTTLLTKIEACLNSRPLCPLTENPEEFYSYLTPGHFLTGSPTMSLPVSDYSESRDVDIRRRWQLTENMMQQFWKSWSNEYLTQLQARGKWNRPTKNLQEGDIVLVKENNLPPGKWAMGRVLEIHPGADGYVRVTTIKTQTGTLKRPIVKLSPLPIEDNYRPEKPMIITPPTSTSRKSSKCENKCFLTLATTLMFTTLFTIITGTYGDSGVTSNVQITNFEPERPIYYDTMGKVQVIHDEWTLRMYYNLTDYWEGVRRIETHLSNVKNFCNKTDPRYCQITMQQIDHEMELLNYYNDILLAPHKHLSNRKKRGLVNGVGYVANSLFGILDQRFANKYQDDIQSIQNNENYILELMKNQTSIIELENRVIKKNEGNIKRQLNLIDTFMKQTNTNFAKIESEMEIVMATSYFNSASLAAYLLIDNLKTIQELLFNTLTDVYKGHIDIHLLTPISLIEQLNNIAGKLPKTLSLPVKNVREDIKEIYKLLYVRARVTERYFLFEIHLPLISDDDFTLYRAIPLPVKIANDTVIMQLKSQHIAVNFEKNTYVSLNENELQLCMKRPPDNYICNKNLPVFNLHHSHAPCEAKLLSHQATTPCDVTSASCKDEWIELHAPNTWLAICCRACKVRSICENDITAHSMTTGVVTLMQGCVLQSDDRTIHSHNQYNSYMKMKILPNYNINLPALNSSINKIVNLTYQSEPSLLKAANREAEDSTNLEKQLDYQKKRLHLPPNNNMSVHDIHHYTVTSVLVTLAVAAAVWVARKRCASCCATRRQRSAHRSEDIEMQSEPRNKPKRPTTRTEPAEKRELPGSSSAADNPAFTFD